MKLDEKDTITFLQNFMNNFCPQDYPINDYKDRPKFYDKYYRFIAETVYSRTGDFIDGFLFPEDTKIEKIFIYLNNDYITYDVNHNDLTKINIKDKNCLLWQPRNFIIPINNMHWSSFNVKTYPENSMIDSIQGIFPLSWLIIRRALCRALIVLKTPDFVSIPGFGAALVKCEATKKQKKEKIVKCKVTKKQKKEKIVKCEATKKQKKEEMVKCKAIKKRKKEEIEKCELNEKNYRRTFGKKFMITAVRNVSNSE
jgi:hypothetical protein